MTGRHLRMLNSKSRRRKISVVISNSFFFRDHLTVHEQAMIVKYMYHVHLSSNMYFLQLSHAGEESRVRLYIVSTPRIWCD